VCNFSVVIYLSWSSLYFVVFRSSSLCNILMGALYVDCDWELFVVFKK